GRGGLPSMLHHLNVGREGVEVVAVGVAQHGAQLVHGGGGEASRGRVGEAGGQLLSREQGGRLLAGEHHRGQAVAVG
nr:hypothetical protein [Tanacetum cinerariifolium]